MKRDDFPVLAQIAVFITALAVTYLVIRIGLTLWEKL